jgi:hypothetical protein
MRLNVIPSMTSCCTGSAVFPALSFDKPAVPWYNPFAAYGAESLSCEFFFNQNAELPQQCG